MKCSVWFNCGLILVIGIIASICSYNWNKDFSLSIFLTALSLAFSYFFYKMGNFQTEQRRLNDLRISAYNNLTIQANTILEDCSKMLIDLHPQCDAGTRRDISHIGITISAKFNRLYTDIKLFDRLLEIRIKTNNISEAQKPIDEILRNPGNVRSIDYYSEVFAKLHNEVTNFSEALSNEILIKKETKSGF